MKLQLLSALFLLSAGSILNAQHQEFYATMDADNAKALKNAFPTEVEIIDSKNNQSALFITEKAAHYIHKNVLTHGPGYVYKGSKDEALSSISKVRKSNKVLNFTITEDAKVNQAINLVNAENIKTHIQLLENYGTRRHTTTTAAQSVTDLKTKWEQMIATTGRTDLSVRLVAHTGTPMKSVVFTMNGQTEPNDFIIVGGHMDTISNTAQAPGADDDGSGIATITEMIRVLLAMNYQPKKSVEFMAFAAEEIGLVGSSEIASSYSAANKNVLSFVQFDMTNYKGSPQDIYLTTDSYNSNDLNLFLIELMTHYNATGTHKLTYGNTICNYGCSDHFSWAENGFDAAFPFEASFNNSNPYIHSSQDKLSNMGGNANHAAKFAKLGLEFIIETAKSKTLATSTINSNEVLMYVENKVLKFQTGNQQFSSVAIMDVSGKKLLEKNILSTGQIDLNSAPKGLYLVIFKSKDGKVFTKKFMLD